MGMAFALDCKIHMHVLAVQPNALLIGIVVDPMQIQERMADHSSCASNAEHHSSRQLLGGSCHILGDTTKTLWWMEFWSIAWWSHQLQANADATSLPWELHMHHGSIAHRSNHGFSSIESCAAIQVLIVEILVTKAAQLGFSQPMGNASFLSILTTLWIFNKAMKCLKDYLCFEKLRC